MMNRPTTYKTTMGPLTVGLMGAPIVPLGVTSGLPSGTLLQTHHLADLNRYGLPARHPQLDVYHPGLPVSYHLMVIPDNLIQRRTDDPSEPPKMGLWFDFRGSGTAASMISYNGRNALAPIDWDMDSNDPMRDPRVQAPLPECRWVQVGGKWYPWYNTLQHGPGRITADWLDGTPSSVTTMYTPEGTVHQIVFVPKFTEGVGIAEQTMAEADVRDTVSILVFNLKPEFAGIRIQREPVFRARQEDYELLLESTPRFRGAGHLEKAALTMNEDHIEADAKVAAGGEISQRLEAPYYPPHMWQAVGVLVFFPVRPAKAARLTAPVGTSGERKLV